MILEINKVQHVKWCMKQKQTHFRHLQQIPSSVSRAWDWWSGGGEFKSHWGQFLMKFFLCRVTLNLSDNLTDMRLKGLTWKTQVCHSRVCYSWSSSFQAVPHSEKEMIHFFMCYHECNFCWLFNNLQFVKSAAWFFVYISFTWTCKERISKWNWERSLKFQQSQTVLITKNCVSSHKYFWIKVLFGT